MTRLASSLVRRTVVTLMITAAVLLGATACVQNRGEQVASDILLDSAEELEGNFENTRNRSRDADYLVATFVPPLNVNRSGTSVVAEPLDWSGNSATETGAELVVRRPPLRRLRRMCGSDFPKSSFRSRSRATKSDSWWL